MGDRSLNAAIDVVGDGLLREARIDSSHQYMEGDDFEESDEHGFADETAKKNFKAMQTRQLEEINKQLIARDLLPLRRLGNHANGEEQITEIISIMAENKWFCIVQFRTKWPYSGSSGVRYVRFAVAHARKHAVVATVRVNGKILLVRQHRACQLTQKKSWCTESYRQWAASGDETSFLKRVLMKRKDTASVDEVGGAHALFGREMSHLMSLPGVMLTNWRVMNRIDAQGEYEMLPEDTGFYAGGVVHLLLDFTAPLEVEQLILDQEVRRKDPRWPEKDNPLEMKLCSAREAYHIAYDHMTMAGLLLLAEQSGAIDYDKIEGKIPVIRRKLRLTSYGLRRKRCPRCRSVL